MILKMAFLNIFRHTKRTILTLVTIIAGIFFAIFSDGITSGNKWQIADTYIKSDYASLKIYAKDYIKDEEKENPLEYPILNDTEKQITTFLASKKWVKAHSARIVFGGSISNGRDEIRVTFTGVTPEEEEKLFNRKSRIVSGHFIDNISENNIVIGSELSSSLQIKTGDTITIMCRTKTKTINAYDVIVKGIIKTGNPIVDSGGVYLSKEFAKSFADVSEMNEISVLTDRKEPPFIDKYKKEIETAFNTKNIMTYGWNDELKDILKLIDLRAKIFLLITVVILLMASAGVANTMLMAMLERKRELGIMMANGMEKKSLLTLFLLEGVIIGFIGSTIALTAGFFLVSWGQNVGIPIPLNENQIGSDFPISERLYLFFDFQRALIFYTIGIVVSSLAALYPAAKASKLQPVDAING